MRHDVNARWLDAQKLLYLRGGGLRYGNNGVAVGGRLAGLLCEARPELGRRIFAGHHEQIVKSTNGALRPPVKPPVETLVESVEKVGARGARQQTAAGVGRQLFSQGLEEAVRAIVETKTLRGVRAGQAGHHLARIHADAG